MKRLTNAQKQQAIDCMNKWIELAEKKSGKEFPFCSLDWFSVGSDAGVAYVQNNRIALNETLMAENFDRFLIDTIPHEVAHMVEWWLYGTVGHKAPWKRIMTLWFGLPATRCHNMDTTSSSKCKLFNYVCQHGCETKLTSIRHNKVVTGKATYCCKKHSSLLRWKTTVEPKKTDQSLPKGWKSFY